MPFVYNFPFFCIFLAMVSGVITAFFKTGRQARILSYAMLITVGVLSAAAISVPVIVSPDLATAPTDAGVIGLLPPLACRLAWTASAFPSSAVLMPPLVTGFALPAAGALSKVSAACLAFHAALSADETCAGASSSWPVSSAADA